MVESVKTVALVNSFNRVALLKEALGSLIDALSQLPDGAAIVVFDAGSTDGSRDYLTKIVLESSNIPIELVFPSKDDDTSFSAGLNRAGEVALQKFPMTERLFFFETDNWIKGAAPLQRAVALLEQHSKLAAVGFTVRKHSGEPAGYGESFPTVGSFIMGPQFSYMLDQTKQRKPIEDWTTCDIVYTSPLLVRRQAWEQSHGMDAKAFPFSDCDLDWAWRLHKLGWQQAVLATDDVVHDNREVLSTWSQMRVISWHRARLKLLSRHRGLQPHCIRPLLFCRHIIELLALMVVPGKKDRGLSLDKRIALIKTVFNDYQMDPHDRKEPANA